VAVLEGGYRIVVAGAGPYLGEEHRIRVERLGRLEAYAVLLDATPVSADEMLAMADVRSDVHEPPRTVGERVDLEENKRKGKRSRTPAKTIDRPTGDVSVEFGEDVEPLEPVEEIDELEEIEETEETGDGDGDQTTDAVAAGDGAAPRKRRRRGKRGGKKRRPAAEGGDESTADEVPERRPESAERGDEDAGAGGEAPKRKRRRRGGRGRSRSGGQRPPGSAGESPKTTRPGPNPAPTPAAGDGTRGGGDTAGGKRKKGLLGRLFGG